jgi:methylated-DNA-protein-cysteine methyltransferase-like protein
MMTTVSDPPPNRIAGLQVAGPLRVAPVRASAAALPTKLGRAVARRKRMPPITLAGPPPRRADFPAMTGRNGRVWSVVRRIPRGRVATYGQIARLAGLGAAARQVGYALHGLPDGTTVPWHRVINAAGRISARGVAGWAMEQRIRLEVEGVRFNARGAVDLARYRWDPRARAARGGRARA